MKQQACQREFLRVPLGYLEVVGELYYVPVGLVQEDPIQQLALIDAALARLDDGTFGICVRCGRPIAAERLDALPWAPRCIDCQRLADRER